MDKRAFSLPEVVELTSIGRSKVYENITSGHLRAVKAGKRTLVLSEDLDAFLKNLPAVNGEL
ncbi:MAG: helix-turn-helix domain-containing protein [Hyphomicrobiales bacterium]|nr:helix-turn-helix domain-containing protein [Hyphomicrobiales bacterium]